MKNIAGRRVAGVVAGLAVVTLVGTACSGDDSSDKAAPSSSSTVTPSSSAASPSASSSAAASSSGAAKSGETVTVQGERGVDVTLSGPVAKRYSEATAAEKKDLGLALTGDHNAGTRDSGVVFQQFKGGVITAKNDKPGTPAYITWGKIRDAWNVERNAEGVPTNMGKNGSAGPLGAVTSNEITKGDVRETTFEHGTVTFNTKTGKVTVTVNGKVVPTK